MHIQINELADGRSIGFGVFEIASFPSLEGSTKEIESELEQAYNTFLHAAEEFYKLGQDSNTAAELMWAAIRQHGISPAVELNQLQIQQAIEAGSKPLE
ncbi:hypothetical protein AGMMS50212_11850 [Spirochaetia bacterium]|nr:hypothetical protein AGMMS50212_11850 [Spirochaetia bacterium]